MIKVVTSGVIMEVVVVPVAKHGDRETTAVLSEALHLQFSNIFNRC